MNKQTKILQGELTDSITRQINRSRKDITILFTDIQDSTKIWDQYGDVKARLIVDQHNRLLFPVVKKYRGRIIKTIGDAIMASFKKPQNAVKAAIAIQQTLAATRQRDERFQLKVRIGVHTGKAIVEDQDVFGDVVNVAARVESEGKGDEILLSGNTAEQVVHDDYCLISKGEFSPKGKSNALMLYKCEWKRFPEDLTRNIKFKSWLPLVARQKRELLLSIVATLGISYLLYLVYIRYLIADFEEAALVTLNPSLLFDQYPYVLWGSVIFVLMLLVFTLIKIRNIPYRLMYFFRGGLGFALGFLLLFLPGHFFELPFGDKWDGVLHESKHLFVRVLGDSAPVYSQPTETASQLLTVKKGDLLLQADVVSRYGYVWNKVLIGPGVYGWVQRVTPPKLGVPSERLTRSNKFYFRYRDLYAVLFGVLGFLWGAFDFRIKPT